jgi:hypothetical protein
VANVPMLKLAEMRMLSVAQINVLIRSGRAFDFVPAFDNPLPSRAATPPPASASVPPIQEGVHYFCQFNALTGRLAMSSSDEQEVENDRVLAFTGTDPSKNIISFWGHLYILRNGGVLARSGQPEDDQAGQIFFVRAPS